MTPKKSKKSKVDKTELVNEPIPFDDALRRIVKAPPKRGKGTSVKQNKDREEDK